MRIGNQHPTHSVVVPYTESRGPEAANLYRGTGREPQEWQESIVNDLLAVNEDGLWAHPKFGYSVPRRNGKGEILTIRELYGLGIGEHICHTAHRTTTSSSASKRLADLLKAAGYEEIFRPKKSEVYSNAFTYSKQFGLERIILLDTNGSVDFRTRTSAGGLGEGFDLLIIDEAQEYTDDQQSTLQYVVSDSPNPQIILCGTPPTAVSKGTIFPKLRDSCLLGEAEEVGWAEWSVDEMSDVNDVDLWYRCNPAMGYQLNERKIKAEDKTDTIDYNIQRLGLWIKYNQKSVITETEWMALEVEQVPKRAGKKFLGIKYGIDGSNVAVAIAFKSPEGKTFVECIDCRPSRIGNEWIISIIQNMTDLGGVIVDGANGQKLLEEAMKEARIKLKPVFPTVGNVIVANAMFEQALEAATICHKAQPSLVCSATNCEKRAIGSNGGFGYKALTPDTEIALLDSVIMAHWLCSEYKEKKTQKINY
jgi:phage terminase large subunit-like protein